MKYSGIGGQAILEGVMMRNQDRYALSCRTSDGEIIKSILSIEKIEKVD